jgi:hypothetical protein
MPYTLPVLRSAVNNIDIILSFNYEHINKFKTKLMTTNINILKGYKGIVISTPLEFMDNEKNS